MRIVEKKSIKVCGLPKEFLRPALLRKEEFFGQYGKIKKVVIKYEKQNGQEPKVIIIFNSPLGACLALLCANQLLIDKRKLRISFGMREVCAPYLLGHCKQLKCSKRHYFLTVQ